MNTTERARLDSSKARILAALQAAGSHGCTNADLNAISYRYGGRLHELRRAGYAIESIDEHEGRWRFVLHTAPRVTAGTPGYLQSLPVVEPQPTTPNGWLF